MHESRRHFSGTLLLTFCLLSIFSNPLLAQRNEQQRTAVKQRILADKRVSSVQVSDERGTASSIVFDANRPAAEAEARPLLRTYLNLRPGYDNFEFAKEVKATKELQVKDYQQYFKGIPVAYSHYKALTKNGGLSMLAGSFYKVPESLSVTPSITEAAALTIAKKHIGAKVYAWEEVQKRLAAATNPEVKKLLEAELKDYLPKADLLVVKDFTIKGRAEMRLAYRFNIYAAEPLSRGYLFIDAHTGKILLYDAIIKHASVPTTVTTRYAGNRVILTKQIAGTDPGNGQTLQSSHPANDTIGGSPLPYIPGNPTYTLIDDTRGINGGIQTYDLNNVGGLPLSVGALYAQAKSFTDVGNHWTLGEHKRSAAEEGANEAENDDIAWDAHWGAEMVYDYWLAKHNRRSYDDQNAGIKNYIHYGPAYDNAFWNGTAMTYGDGSGEAAGGFKALTSLDVCGHEIGHGVCSFTSDLVYANESGAMNEGFSDIWAACVENFVIKQVDPTLAAKYKPFFIGEQISSSPLRRMDAPKLAGNPDTRYGTNYDDPNCAAPSLANDQCGVHNNSAIINKWFYLLTCGSGAGSGPDKNYVIPGADDSKRDDTTGGTITQDIIPYSVTGLGFDVTEQIAFLTEVLLTSTATYDEAREVSIDVAKAYSGDPCGDIVKQVTNAWNAVGVGPAFVAPCTVTYGFVGTTSRTVAEGANGAGCNGTDTLTIPILIPANGTATVTVSGTAIEGVDYVLSGKSFTGATSGNVSRNLLVAIFNDGVVENDESIILTVAINNATGIVAKDTINIVDNDVAPRIGTDSVVLLRQNFDGTPSGYNLPPNWAEIVEIPEDPSFDPTTAGKNHWGVFMPGSPNSSKSLAVTGRINNPLLPFQAPDGNYISTSPSQTLARTPLIDARGLGDMKLSFDFTVQGEVDPNGTDFEQFGKFDYMEVTYSFDGVNFQGLGESFAFAMAQPFTGRFDNQLPAFLNSKQFYLAFRWFNDTNAGGPFSASVDSVVIKAMPARIETVQGATGNERLRGTQEVYFYSNPAGNLIAKVNATGTSNYGCITAKMEKAGSSTFTLYTGAGKNVVADRVVRLTPATNVATGTYNISLYFTEQEIAALEAATGKTRNSMVMYKTSAATLGAVTSTNTITKPATYTAIAGVGGIFSATFTTGFSAFAVGSAETTITDFFRTKQNGIWSNATTWESSANGTDYMNATLAPNNNSNNILLRNGHTVTITSPLTIDQTVVQPASTLNVNSTLTVLSNGLRLTSDANGMGRIGTSTGTISGGVTVDRFIPADRAWRLINAPLSASETINASWQEAFSNVPGIGTQITGGTQANGFDPSPTNNPSIKIHDQATQSFVGIPSTFVPVSDHPEGYFLFVRGDRTVTASQGNNAPATPTTLSVTGSVKMGQQTFPVPNNGFTLIGNPYASPVNFTTLTKTNINDRYYVWDPKRATIGAYVLFEGPDYAPLNDGGSYTGPNTTIQSSQAFFVEANAAGGQIVFKESDKTATQRNVFRTGSATDPRMKVNLHFFNADNTPVLADGAAVRYNNEFSADVNADDAGKPDNIDENIAVLRNGKNLTMEKRPTVVDGDIVPLKMYNMKQRTYEFEVVPENFSVNGLVAYLEDDFLKTSTPLSLTQPTRVQFTVTSNPASANPVRFRIVYRSGKLPIVAVSEKADIRIYPNPVTGKTVNIQFDNQAAGRYTVRLLNNAGQTMYTSIINHAGGSANQTLRFNSVVPKGTYRLQVINGETTLVRQLIIE